MPEGPAQTRKGRRTMRADRLMQIMILLQNHGKMTTRQLADMLEVSERTILRDMDALSVAGIPVIAERGKYGGWKLIDRFRSTISGLTLDELKSLFILPSDQLLEQLGIQPGGTGVRRKLAAAMPRPVEDSARQYLKKIHIDTGTWRPAGGAHKETLRDVLAALWEDRRIRIRYRKAGEELTERTVGPLGLVLKGSVWYLVAMHGSEETRTYRIARIVHADILPETFVRPARFDLAAYWKQSKERFAASLPTFEVHVRFDPAIAGRLTFTDKFVRKAEIGEVEDDGLIPAVLHFQTEEEAAAYALGFGDKMQVVRPASLIPRIVEKATAAIALYDRPPHRSTH